MNLANYGNVENLLLASNGVSASPWFGEGNAGANVIVGSDDANYLVGGAGNDTLDGTGQKSTLVGYAAPNGDVLEGGDGDDVLLDYTDKGYYYPHGKTVMQGGAGNDFYLLYFPYDAEISDSLGTDTVYVLYSADLRNALGIERIVLAEEGTAEYHKALAAENAIRRVAESGLPNTHLSGSLYHAIVVTGNDAANTIVGNSYNNDLRGWAGNDTIYGDTGDDTLSGGAGNDSLIGGLGDDVYVFDEGDVIVELAGQGVDTVKSLSLTGMLVANVEGFEFTGRTDVLLEYGVANTRADRLTGGLGNDTINGYGGDDLLAGGLGNDSLSGGDGRDTLLGGEGADQLFGGAGDDNLDGEGGNDSIFGGAGNDDITGDLFGVIGNDTIDGGDGNDSISGQAGNDFLLGGLGQDVIRGGDGNDTIDGGEGADSLDGWEGDDFIRGGTGSDSLFGGAGSDTLVASGGGDLNVSYWGDGDKLSGGDYASAWPDVFRFEASSGYSAVSIVVYSVNYGLRFATGDLITDFGSSDRIELARAMVGDGDALLENVATKAVAGGNFAKAAEMLIVQADINEAIDATTYWWNSISAAAVVAQIGKADVAFAVGDRRIFVVDDGNDSAIFRFTSDNADTIVSADELQLVAVVNDVSTLSSSDIFLY